MQKTGELFQPSSYVRGRRFRSKQELEQRDLAP
jgi:hypothetical protein